MHTPAPLARRCCAGVHAGPPPCGATLTAACSPGVPGGCCCMSMGNCIASTCRIKSGLLKSGTTLQAGAPWKSNIPFSSAGGPRHTHCDNGQSLLCTEAWHTCCTNSAADGLLAGLACSILSTTERRIGRSASRLPTSLSLGSFSPAAVHQHSPCDLDMRSARL